MWLNNILSDYTIIGSFMVNSYEEKDCYFLEVCIPGLRKEEVAVRVPSSDLLEIELKPEKIDTERRVWLKREWNRAKPMIQEIELPSGVDESSIKAKVENGVLLITIPKSKKEGVEIEVE